MNIYLQFAIPIAVTFIALTLITVLRRRWRAGAIVLCAALLAAAVGLGIPGVRSMKAELDAAPETEEPASVVYDQYDNDRAIAMRYILDGEYSAAADILDNMGVSDGGVALLKARLCALEGDYVRSRLLYRSAGPGSDESDLAAAMISDAYGNTSLITYLTEQSIDPAVYGIRETETAAQDPGGLDSLISSRLSSEYDNLASHRTDIAEASEIASSITEYFSAYTSGYSVDTVAVQSCLEELDAAMGGSEAFLQNRSLRIARLKGLLILGKYDEIAGSLDELSGTEELMIAIELYISGEVGDYSFPESYTELDTATLDAVLERCVQIRQNAFRGVSGDVRSAYSDKIEQLRSMGETTAPESLRRQLSDSLSGTTGNLTSKGYLELSKLEQHLGNDDLSNAYLDRALGTAEYSTDDAYREPMNSLVDIIEGTSDTDSVKQIAQYVGQAIDHSLPLDVTGELLTYSASGASDDSYESYDGDASSYSTFMTESVSQKTAMINIGLIDKSAFPEVTARVQFGADAGADADQIKSILNVDDCGYPIEDFTLDALELSTSRIILLCDVSGSMSGSVQQLKDAVTTFADAMTTGEQVSVMGFDDNIKFSSEFLTKPDEIKSYTDSIGAYGGTDMYSALLTAMDKFPYDINANNVVILLTDGCDNYSVGEGTMRSTITPAAVDKGITVYTLGLGSGVDTGYLELIADTGNGSFLYIDSDESLSNFFSFVHQQLYRQYILKYTAKNRSMNERKLTLSLTDVIGQDSKTYYLVDPEYSDQSPDAYIPYTVSPDELAVYGLSTKLLYRGSSPQKLVLAGNGFDEGDEFTVSLSAGVAYKLETEFVDSKTLNVTVPANIAVGVYDLSVSVRGETFDIKKELTVAAPGSMRTFKYGDYTFTSLSSSQSGGATVLSGSVIMNGWLRFRGDVTINGDYLSSGYITLTDNDGAYVEYLPGDSGLAGQLASEHVSATLPALGDFKLYTDKYTPQSYSDFPADTIDIYSGINFINFLVNTCRAKLYPDCMRFELLNLGYEFPMQKQLLKNLKLDMFKESLTVSYAMICTPSVIGLNAHVDYNNLQEDFAMVSLPLRLSKLKVDVDTVKNDYAFEGEVQFKSFLNGGSVGLSFGVKDGIFDSIGVSTSDVFPSITVAAAPVPVAVKDFGFELKGLSAFGKDTKENFLMKILGTTVSFKFATTVGDVFDKLPGLKDLFPGKKELALATLKDCTISATLKTFTFKFSCDVYLLSAIDIGHAELEAGTFKYSNALLGIYDNTQIGLRAAITANVFKWDAFDQHLSISASGELVVGAPVALSLWLNGESTADIGWWILRYKDEVKGDIIAAFFINSNDKAQFSLAVRGMNKTTGKYDGWHFYIVFGQSINIHTY